MLDDIALEIGHLVIGGIILVGWLGGGLKISDWNQNLGIVWVCRMARTGNLGDSLQHLALGTFVYNPLSKALAKAEANLEAVDAAPTSEDPAECVADKGYHS